MLASDGVTLTKLALNSYLDHLSTGICDLITLFDSVEDPEVESQSGTVPEGERTVQGDQIPDDSFDTSFALPEAFKTPSGSVPRSSTVGVRDVCYGLFVEK